MYWEYPLSEPYVFHINGFFLFDKRLMQQPWGSVDWQTGIERWCVSCLVVFHRDALQQSLLSIPEGRLYIDQSTIQYMNEDFVKFNALFEIGYNPYYSIEPIDNNLIRQYGFFADVYKNVIGEFSIDRITTRLELTTRIN